jgi:trans-aconitate 2-methyltransferase
MLHTAARWLGEHGPRVRLVQADGALLPFRRAFDAIFSNATFHWIPDHASLFRSLIMTLRPGGRVVAQCGGGPNLALLYARADGVARQSFFAQHFLEWTPPGNYADVESTRRRLESAGFVDVSVWLEAAPTSFSNHSEFQDFVATVCLREHLARLPPADRPAFMREITMQAAADAPPFTLDYWRLNIDARRPA